MPADPTEANIRNLIADLMPLEHAPAHLRLAFHDAGTFDATTQTGGAHATIRLAEELHRASNTGWGQVCFDLLSQVREAYPDVSWADLIALGGAAAVMKCGGPIIEVGMGRTDGAQAAPTGRLPGGYEDAGLLKRVFTRMGLTMRDLVALSGAHTLGHTQRRPFTTEPWVFSNAYYRQLVAAVELSILPTDNELMKDAELRPYVELYAEDENRFREDFADAYRRLTWLGNTNGSTATVLVH